MPEKARWLRGILGRHVPSMAITGLCADPLNPARSTDLNYLAHVHLSCHSPEAVTGAILGDFAKGRRDREWPAAVQSAVRLHREIDAFTDRHSRVRQSCARVSEPRRRFAGILVDVFYDHFLARHWRRFSPQGLEQFTRRVYDVLWPQRDCFPSRLQRILPYMVGEDWLASYAEVDAVEAAIGGIAWRLRKYERARVLNGAIGELLDQYAGLESDFLSFYPELVWFTDSRRLEADPA